MSKANGEQQLIDLLTDIDARMDAEKIPGMLGLYVFGAAAAVLAYGSPRTTTDIDAYLEDKRLEKRILDWAGKGSELAQRHGVYFQAANLALMLVESPEWKSRCVELLPDRFRRIRVFAVSPIDLILSKLARYSSKDEVDIGFLARSGKVDPEYLIHLYRSAREYYVGDLKRLDSTFNYVLGEYFARKPVAFGG